jgi:hypothetical protein
MPPTSPGRERKRLRRCLLWCPRRPAAAQSGHDTEERAAPRQKGRARARSGCGWARGASFFGGGRARGGPPAGGVECAVRLGNPFSWRLRLRLRRGGACQGAPPPSGRGPRGTGAPGVSLPNPWLPAQRCNAGGIEPVGAAAGGRAARAILAGGPRRARPKMFGEKPWLAAALIAPGGGGGGGRGIEPVGAERTAGPAAGRRRRRRCPGGEATEQKGFGGGRSKDRSERWVLEPRAEPVTGPAARPRRWGGRGGGRRRAGGAALGRPAACGAPRAKAVIGDGGLGHARDARVNERRKQQELRTGKRAPARGCRSGPRPLASPAPGRGARARARARRVKHLLSLQAARARRVGTSRGRALEARESHRIGL